MKPTNGPKIDGSVDGLSEGLRRMIDDNAEQVVGNIKASFGATPQIVDHSTDVLLDLMSESLLKLAKGNPKAVSLAGAIMELFRELVGIAFEPKLTDHFELNTLEVTNERTV